MKWRLQFLILIFLMSFFVMGGIHLAEKGTMKIDGFENEPVQSFHIKKVSDGSLEMTVLGKAYTVEESALWAAKPVKVDTNKNYSNWVSDAGNYFGHVLYQAAKSIVSWIE